MSGRERLPQVGKRVQFNGVFVGCHHSSDGTVIGVERRERPTNFPGAAPHMETRIKVQFDAKPYNMGEPVSCGERDPFVHELSADAELRSL
jgi:hypothetical protein